MSNDQNAGQQQGEGWIEQHPIRGTVYHSGPKPSDAPKLPDGVRTQVHEGAMRLDNDGLHREGVSSATSSPASEADGVVVRTSAGYPVTLAEASADSRASTP